MFQGAGLDRLGRAISSIPIYRCPSRGGPAFKPRNGFGSEAGLAGPTGDYFIPSAHSTKGEHFMQYTAYRPDNNTSGFDGALRIYKSPFRVANCDFNAGADHGAPDPGKHRDNMDWITDWTWRDDMSWWFDGTSNQLILAEKFAPTWAVHAGSTHVAGNRWYGNIYLPKHQAAEGFNIARTISTNGSLFALGPNDPYWDVVVEPHNTAPGETANRNNSGALGSCHPGVVNICLGDGSVRAVPISTLPEVMWKLTCVDDGELVSLP